MERRNARTAGRSALAQSCARVDFAALILAAIEDRSRFSAQKPRGEEAVLAALGMTPLFVFGQA